MIDGAGKQLLDAGELAAWLGRNRRWVYRSIGHGLPAVRVGGRVFFRPEMVQAWLDRQAA